MTILRRRRLFFEPLEDRRVLAAAFPEFVDPNPSPGDLFGSAVVPLSTGNVVITAPYDDAGGTNAGAVYLFNGRTGQLISKLTGSHANDYLGSAGVTALSNGNFVVSSPAWDTYAGAATWGDGTKGISGVVGPDNSLVGNMDTPGRRDSVSSQGVFALTNGNYVVASGFWYYTQGAATWGDGTKGISGEVSYSNSLTGNSTNCYVGVNGVTALTNGNYVVLSSNWTLNGGINNVGAATWGDGTKGITGFVSSANSLTGSQANDRVGAGGITALPNGNYVVDSYGWSNGTTANVGAVTFGDGTNGISGTISSANSLIGGTTNDQVGSGNIFFGRITVLANGNYVVASSNWANGAASKAGAVTWGSGISGVSGSVGSTNSLVGTSANDQVGYGVTALTNGNYVVESDFWNGQEGAATWGDGVKGVSGVVSDANSLVGSTAGDAVSDGGVIPLTNGNYVVNSYRWHNGTVQNAGAVTFGNGASGISGPVSAANSLIGSTAGDFIGYRGVTALANGNYVVNSSYWDNGTVQDVGAVTWGDGTTGISGPVSAANSLVGSTTDDDVGLDGVTALANGNYVVISSYWDNGTVQDAGAVTWGGGTKGISGAVSSANSLVGAATSDVVGHGFVTALTNGNYVVCSPAWDNGTVQDAGAVTFGNGANGISGTISAANSLVGSTANDVLGQIGSGIVTALPNGNYVVRSPSWDNGTVQDAGAVTFGDGTKGVHGAVTADNSLVGAAANSGLGSTVPLDNVNKTFIGQFTSEGRVRVGSQINGLAAPWQNALKPNDVTNDGVIATNDVADVVLYLNAYGQGVVPINARTSKPFGLVDVTGDGVVATNDAVDIIIYLNTFGAGEGEQTRESGFGGRESEDASHLDALMAVLATDASQARKQMR